MHRAICSGTAPSLRQEKTTTRKVANNDNAKQQHHRPCSRSLGSLPDCHCQYRFLGKRSTTQAPSTVSSKSPATKKPASTPTPPSLFPNATYRPPLPVRSSSAIPPLHDPPLPSFPLPHYQHQPTLPPMTETAKSNTKQNQHSALFLLFSSLHIQLLLPYTPVFQYYILRSL